MRRRLTIAWAILLLVVPNLLAQWQTPPPRPPKASPMPSPLAVSSASLPQTAEASPGRRSVLLAVVTSMILPGAGEYYAGNFQESGRYSLAAEAALWVTYAGFTLHGTWVRNDARSFGVQMAGVSFAGKDDAFEVNIGNYLNVDEYNQAKLRNREFEKVYTDPAYAWAWSSDADRERFRDERIRSDRILQAAKFAVAGLVVNRVISAFAAGRGAAAANRAARRAEWGIGLNAGVDPAGAPALSLSFQQRW